MSDIELTIAAPDPTDLKNARVGDFVFQETIALDREPWKYEVDSVFLKTTFGYVSLKNPHVFYPNEPEGSKRQFKLDGAYVLPRGTKITITV